MSTTAPPSRKRKLKLLKGQTPSTKSSSPTSTQKRESDVEKKTTPFSWNQIFKALAVGKAQHKNFVFSPCSIHLALSLVANGSSGSTLKELLRFTEAKTLEDLNSDATNYVEALTGTFQGGPTLSLVSGVWVHKSSTLNPDFKSIAQTVYKGKAEEVDFIGERKSAADNVNRFVEEATNGIIKDFVTEDSFDEFTRVVLANALYFKGNWTNEFVKSLTQESKFFTLDGKFVLVPFMTNRQEKQFISSFEDFKVLRLPYQKATLSMHIILPNEKDGIWSLIEKAGSDPSFFDKYVGPKTMKVEVGKFKVPRFKTKFEFESSGILQSLGLQLPFSGGAKFSKMVDLEQGEELYISTVVHQAFIEVDEEGTEASACTMINWTFDSFCENPPPRVDFVADHPFMFVIRDNNTGMVLFMGHVLNPSLS